MTGDEDTITVAIRATVRARITVRLPRRDGPPPPLPTWAARLEEFAAARGISAAELVDRTLAAWEQDEEGRRWLDEFIGKAGR